ncbi:MAG: TetR/AcrR family transcriptional regulator [Chloroflexi bacterium]|jgi:TetR/AcrR family transcriptional regulator, fatty acid metabolism regulator protein|nr:TetR/AcrR family transcriptional regulator [Chloroflexota bacterium]
MLETEKTTRQRILDAAVERFAQNGYHNTSVADIVSDSQTSKGAVYFHFPSKEEIFLGLVDEFAAILEKRLKEAIDKETSGVRRVNTALCICMETFTSYQKLAKIFLIQAVGLGAAFEKKQREIHLRFIRLIQQHLDEAVQEGDILPLDTEIAAYAWMGAINEVIIEWVHTGHPTPKRALPGLQTVLLRSLGISEERIHHLENL